MIAASSADRADWRACSSRGNEGSNWLFAGSLRAGKRAAATMSLLQSSKLNGQVPHAFFSRILEPSAREPRQSYRQTAASVCGTRRRPPLRRPSRRSATHLRLCCLGRVSACRESYRCDLFSSSLYAGRPACVRPWTTHKPALTP